jgi:uncharacterized protein YgiB involved in biofilm formation
MQHPLNRHLNFEFYEKIEENKICLSLPNKSAVLWVFLCSGFVVKRLYADFCGFKSQVFSKSFAHFMLQFTTM